MQKNNNGKKPQATILVIFGGSGDLNQRKLTPALFNLCIDGFMPEKFAIIGTGRTNYSNEDFRNFPVARKIQPEVGKVFLKISAICEWM